MPEQDFRADRATYIKAHVFLAVIGSVVITGILLAIGNPYPWTGIVATVLALLVRGWFMMSEELGHVWTLSNTDLSGPMGRRVLLDNITHVRTIGSAVQVISTSGDKYMIKFLSDPDNVKRHIAAAAGVKDRDA